jgi:hypothetical protein
MGQGASGRQAIEFGMMSRPKRTVRHFVVATPVI